MCTIYDLLMVLAAVSDLMFSSKIRAAAAGAGTPVTFVRSLDALEAELGRSSPSLLIVDLDRSVSDPVAFIKRVRDDTSLAGVSVVAFGAHVNVDVLRAAREAGADTVLARSGFVTALPDLLTRAGSGQ